MLQGKRVFKVISPMEGRGGTKYWMRLGSGFENKDQSINLYIDAIPVGQKEVVLQLRELDENELRERAEKKATYQSRGSFDGASTRGSFDGGSTRGSFDGGSTRGSFANAASRGAAEPTPPRAPVDYNGLAPAEPVSSDVPF